jgi:hypothetical protein
MYVWREISVCLLTGKADACLHLDFLAAFSFIIMASHVDKGTFMAMVKKHPEIAPVLGVCGLGCVMSALYIAKLCNHPETVWTRSGGDQPWANRPQTEHSHLKIFSNIKSENLKDISKDVNDLRGKF